MRDTTCFAPQVKRPSSLPTVRNKTDNVKKRRSAKLEALAFDPRITSHSNSIRRYYRINGPNRKGWSVAGCPQVTYA